MLRLRTPPETVLAHALTFLGSEIVVGAAAVIILAGLLRRGPVDRALTFALAVGGSVTLTVALKILVARPRPGRMDVLGPVDPSYSFPSGHTLNSAVLIALVGWLVWHRCTTTARIAVLVGGGLLAVAIGLSRVYLGYHWLTDVIASLLVAFTWLSVVVLARAHCRTRSGHYRRVRKPNAVARTCVRSLAQAGTPSTLEYNRLDEYCVEGVNGRWRRSRGSTTGLLHG